MKIFNLIFLILAASCQNNSSNKEDVRNKSLVTETTTVEKTENATIESSQEDKVENSIGVITLSKEYAEKDTVKIYNSDGSLWYKFSYFYDDSDGEYDFYNEEFRPLAFHPDHFLLALKVIQPIDGKFEVVVNKDTGLKKYVKKDDPVLEFHTWKEYVLNVFAVGFNTESNPIRQESNKQASIIPYNPDEFYRPNQIKGEWLQVKWGTDSNWKYGWIKWKEGKSLLIELFHFA